MLQAIQKSLSELGVDLEQLRKEGYHDLQTIEQRWVILIVDAVLLAW